MSDSSIQSKENVDDAGALESVTATVPVKISPFRSTFFQATVLGCCSFLAPGIWGAMSATGGGGTQSVSLVNAANSSTFCLMVVTGLLTPTLIHLFNVRWVLVFGTLGYAPYCAALFTHQKYGTEWFVVFGAVLCGISAGCFWSTEGAIILAYPERENQGKYLSYWLMFRVAGQLVGGAVNLGLNIHNDKAGSLSTNTYLVFVVLQCLGPLFALLISLPHQVQRKDGTPVLLNLNPNIKSELLAMVKILQTRKVLLLLPLIWQGTFSEALIGTYAAENFTVRSRALGSLLSAIVAALACYILGFYLDCQRWSINKRGITAFASIYVMQLAWWAWAIYEMNLYHKTKPTLDFGQSEWSRGFAVYIFLQIGFNLMYEYIYWLIGASNDEPGEIVRLSSIIRSVESAGQAVSYGLNSTSWRLDAIASLNLGFTVAGIIPAWFVVRSVGVLADGTKIFKPAIYATKEDREVLERAGHEQVFATTKEGEKIHLTE
ncbi:hypothetical protein CBS101457_000760 [Exobasidium rhododendri]|nr:hypothetical protein CBS101457_000760 [Exobasidium rhododendri]